MGNVYFCSFIPVDVLPVSSIADPGVQQHFKDIEAYFARRDISMADRDLCFGSRSSSFWPLIIGALIILVGVIELFGDTYRWLNWDNVWPLIVIAFGLLIVGNALYKR